MIKFLPHSTSSGLAVLMMLLLASVGLNFWFFRNQNQNNLDWHVVANVVDGDTIETADHMSVRLLGINAPEKSACGSEQAKKELEKLVLNKKVRLETQMRDAYNRLIAVVYLPDGKSVGVAMLESGWAAYDTSNGTDKEALKAAGAGSREAKRGIYSSLCSQYSNPVDPKCSIKGNYDKRRETKLYFFKGCRLYDSIAVNLYSNDQWFCSEKEAREAGFTKAEKCYDFKFSP